MFNLRLGVIPLLFMPILASSDITHAATSEPCKLRSITRVAVRPPSIPISAEPPKPSPLEALNRALEQRGCAAVEHRTPLRKIDSAVARAAQTLLDLPMGAGRLMSVNGRELLFCLELHYHEPGFERGPEGWHKGVTVYFTT
jgi:hypothetical protein